MVPLERGHNTHFYFYAYGEDRSVWGGNNRTYVNENDRFLRCKESGPDHASDSALSIVGMDEIQIETSETTYTLRLVPAGGESQGGCTTRGDQRLCPVG